MALWDGRFSSGPAEDMVRFSESLDVDLRMWREDIEGSRAHARGLAHVGLLTSDELQTLLDGLDRVAGELERGEYVPTPDLEDIHMAVESRLTALVGPVGAKLHTARSRNDQVATDVRLWMRTRMKGLHAALVDLVLALVERVEADGDVLMPGFTHLQRGQPILLGHHLLAHAFTVQRDADRLADALKRLDASPLGAGAMAGTPHAIDRHFTAEALGFSGPVHNAMDAVAARDHQLECASVCAIAMTHLSRMAEELVLWSTSEFRFVRMGEAYATGSSIMPQKRNPDAAELVRGKVGRVHGALQSLLVMVKGLPLAYNRDLQEDRQALFDSVETTTASVRITAGMWRTLTVTRDRYERELEGDFLLATELADYLAAKGVPFRDAHHVSGRLVAWCEAHGTDFGGLTLEVMKQHHPAFEPDVMGWLVPRAAAERRTSFGGTAPSEVARQVAHLRGWVSAR
ncbi:MAG: argininosuccinate lyase, partial [Alphaproteobacteria bacterium]|nr:argininosuccinate lyase [Alphaproteobacteria bacterium]